jgi:hypothetical protein
MRHTLASPVGIGMAGTWSRISVRVTYSESKSSLNIVDKLSGDDVVPNV